MNDYHSDDYRNQGESWQRKGARFVRYLTTRKSETWFFFIAGFVIASILN
ncbi:hypothetical protein DES40_1957 [Litorimonas taeanensis]|uniref:Uncharacterized protein n=1 Tax=Litorimonas taeanensis TaxID=568099 RepID=A0A420WE32_9PROT|nr:hypothetical protein [Litorimonas taeanensis]RKQ69170.1 hypothetical protein DES40_1957 [Litorimonas taeanensis]